MITAKTLQVECSDLMPESCFKKTHSIVDWYQDALVGRYGFSDPLWSGGLHCIGIAVDPDWQTTRVALGASSPLAHLACRADGFCGT